MAETLASPPAWFRGARALVRRLPAGRFRAFGPLRTALRRPFLDRMHPRVGGWSYRCDLRDLVAAEICLTGRYAPLETALVLDSLRPGDTFVDVGANIGYFALAAASRVGAGGRVVALEPDPRLAALLRENLALNGELPVSVLEVAAGARQGSAELIGFAEHGGNWGVSTLLPGTDGARFQVAVAPLDDLLDQVGVEEADMIKIDVEGAEFEVLRGMRCGLQAGRFRRVLVELHPWFGGGYAGRMDALIAEMAAAGYTGYLIDDAASATRRMYYGGWSRPALRPLRAEAVREGWPHVLWSREPEPV